MVKFLIKDTTLVDIADSIRSIDGSQDRILVSEIGNQIREKTKNMMDAKPIVNWAYFFYNDVRTHLIDHIGDISNAQICERMFYNCQSIKSLPNELNLCNLSIGANGATYMFYNCKNLTTLKLKTNSLCTTATPRMFYQTSFLENLTINGTIKVNSNDFNLAYSPQLTVESLLSVLNALEDNTGEDTKYTVYFGSTNLAKLTQEQREIAYLKNIDLA